MRKAVIGAVAAITAIAPTPLLAATWEVAHATTGVVTTPVMPPAPRRTYEPPQGQQEPPVVHQAPPTHNGTYEGPPVQREPPVHQAPSTHVAPPVITTHEAAPATAEPPVTQAPTHTVHTPVTQEPHGPSEPRTTEVDTPKVIPPTIARSTQPAAGSTPPGAVIPSTQPAERRGSGTSLGPNDGSPREVSTSVRKLAHVAPPLMGVPPGDIAKAKAAPPAVIEPGHPPPPPVPVNFTQQVQDLVRASHTNIDVVNAGNQVVVRPRRWDYIDYDEYHRPILYNPISEALTFRYFYDGDYRDVYIPVGGRIVLNISIVGSFPFTAVGLDYITVGNFTGGAWIPPDGWVGPPPDSWTPPPPPQVWQNVTVSAVDTETSVQVNNVTVVGHDDSRPQGQQDTLMLDDSTLAWGQVQDARDGGAVQISNVQTLPGVGPMCGAGQWMNTALESSTHQGGITRLEWVLGAGLSVTSLVGGGATWFIRRLRGAHI